MRGREASGVALAADPGIAPSRTFSPFFTDSEDIGVNLYRKPSTNIRPRRTPSTRARSALSVSHDAQESRRTSPPNIGVQGNHPDRNQTSKRQKRGERKAAEIRKQASRTGTAREAAKTQAVSRVSQRPKCSFPLSSHAHPGSKLKAAIPTTRSVHAPYSDRPRERRPPAHRDREALPFLPAPRKPQPLNDPNVRNPPRTRIPSYSTTKRLPNVGAADSPRFLPTSLYFRPFRPRRARTRRQGTARHEATTAVPRDRVWRLPPQARTMMGTKPVTRRDRESIDPYRAS